MSTPTPTLNTSTSTSTNISTSTSTNTRISTYMDTHMLIYIIRRLCCQHISTRRNITTILYLHQSWREELAGRMAHQRSTDIMFYITIIHIITLTTLITLITSTISTIMPILATTTAITTMLTAMDMGMHMDTPMYIILTHTCMGVFTTPIPTITLPRTQDAVRSLKYRIVKEVIAGNPYWRSHQLQRLRLKRFRCQMLVTMVAKVATDIMRIHPLKHDNRIEIDNRFLHKDRVQKG
ncbi:MAG: hypothetical protein J3Q66DRAFT_348722 [Benniella sp.]|nr:MAG: hypothetical protein J3Q66DRAFT_348722 [Benniella sp.]